jgi:hypothetical protein
MEFISTRFAVLDQTATTERLAKRGITVIGWTPVVRTDGRAEVQFEIEGDREAAHKSLFAWKGIVLWASLMPVEGTTRTRVEVTGEKQDLSPAVVVGAIKKLGGEISKESTSRVRGYHFHSNGFKVRSAPAEIIVDYVSKDSVYANRRLEEIAAGLTEAGFAVETRQWGLSVKGWRV